MPHPTALSARRRAEEIDRVASGEPIDVLVVGGGITGVGIAVDAASRGLRTVLVERGDLACGTSGASSKLVHGGLRYLASGDVRIAHESAVERGLLLTRIAPHLTRAVAQVLPLYAPDHRGRGAFLGAGFGLGDLLRRAARTPADVLPSPQLLSAAQTRELFPALAAGPADAPLRGGLKAWDGQLIDDARLVVAVARTAAGFGARILTRVEARRLSGGEAELLDRRSGESFSVQARAVINAAGVWAGALSPEVHLAPSRGTHLVVASARLGHADVSLTVAVPGSRGRFVFTLPALHGRTYIGVTDVAADVIEDRPRASAEEIDFLLQTVNTVLENPLTPGDVVGTFAGQRPLLRQEAGAAETADLSRRHSVHEDTDGVISVVGGKLTTYRRMAEDGVDAAVRHRSLPTARPSITRDLPLVGAWPRARRADIHAPDRLIARYGAEAPFVAALAPGEGAACGVSAQELEWAVRVEGALTVEDVLDRRTRLGLVAADAEASASAVRAAFDRAGVTPDAV